MVKPFHEMFIEKLPSLVEKIGAIRLQTEIEGDYSLNIQFSSITINYNTATGDLVIITPEKMSNYNHKKLSFNFNDMKKGLTVVGVYPAEFIKEDKKLLKNLNSLIILEITRSIIETDYPNRKTYNKEIRNEILKKMMEKEEQYTAIDPKRLLKELLKDYQ